mgnify:CR=1 FL=1
MHANRQLQARLDNAEQKLEIQTDQISSYLTEARTDGLTGLLNRKAFDIALDGLFDDWESKGQCFSMGIIDIDHFKQINDTYGHQAGDKVLRTVADAARSVLREGDTLLRYGGEEFLAVLPGAGTDDLDQLGDRIRREIEASVTSDQHQEIRVTVSLGAVAFPSTDVTDIDDVNDIAVPFCFASSALAPHAPLQVAIRYPSREVICVMNAAFNSVTTLPSRL